MYVWQKINDSINRTVDEIMLDTLVRETKQDGNATTALNEKHNC